MSSREVSQVNAYAVTTSDLALPPVPKTSDASEPLLQVGDRTNVGGRLWSPCTQTVYADRIELKFLFQSFTIPIEKVTKIPVWIEASGDTGFQPVFQS